MQKAEIIEKMAEKTGLSKKEAGAALNAFISTVTEGLKNGEPTQLTGFGTFSVVQREARKGRNPKTKEEIIIPACKVAKFKLGKALKDSVA